ncbi:hypothetical protein RFI_16988, partial [Reticulomyxa filosa]
GGGGSRFEMKGISNNDSNNIHITITNNHSNNNKSSINSENSVASAHNASTSKIPKLSLRDVLSDKYKLEVFMDFLVAEYSHENLLAIIELTQFKTFVLSLEQQRQQQQQQEQLQQWLPSTITAPHSNLTLDVGSGTPFSEVFSPRSSSTLIISLPPDIVQSHIVTCAQFSLHQKFVLLVEKYILSNATFCLNISSDERNCLVDHYRQSKNMPSSSSSSSSSPISIDTQTQSSVDFSIIFDACTREIFCLVSDSFKRFMSTDMYQKLFELTA